MLITEIAFSKPNHPNALPIRMVGKAPVIRGITGPPEKQELNNVPLNEVNKIPFSMLWPLNGTDRVAQIKVAVKVKIID